VNASVMKPMPTALAANRRTNTLVLFIKLPFLGIMAHCIIEAPTQPFASWDWNE
jgi:hypothetical protein